MNLIEAYTQPKPVAKVASFKEDVNNSYRDPLREWPVRGCAYSNEIGAAIHGISPTLGTALWIPALMYIGADVYDKYKNDETTYSPSVKRGAQEAVFQGLASVILPTAAVCFGQRIASSLNRFTDNGLSTQSKIDVLNKSIDFIQSDKLNTENSKKFSEEFTSKLLDESENKKAEFKSSSTLKKFISVINPFKDADNIAHSDKSKLGEYASKQAEELFEMHEQLLSNKKPEKMKPKMFEKFQKIQGEYAKIHPKDKYMGEAAKTILKEYVDGKIFQNKCLKTVGGFISLFMLIMPIDNFVEHVVIKKTVEPGLDYLEENYKNSKTQKTREKEEEEDIPLE